MSLPSSGDLPSPGIEPWLPAMQEDSLLFEPPGKFISLPIDLNHFNVERQVPSVTSW